ncbi:hypothetical protein HGRIS_010363 [Hohenbuehelia grisea]|uniref:Uncharacterized protein n=1 Tax=Hohenbuehelia grisea TaxID=104357 RepID=A0ABR3J4H4_9AGAR
MYSLWLTLTALLCFAEVCCARESNAERLARGLTPLRPRFRSILPGFSPTRVFTAKRNVASNFPIATSYSGRIEVRNKDGDVLGYVKNWSGSAPISGVNWGASNEELHIQFNIPQTVNDPGPFDIVVTNPNFASPFYVGVSTGSPVTLKPGELQALGFSNVPQTPAGSPPMNTGSAYTESRIWTFKKDTKQLIPQYINPDGSKPATVIAFSIKYNQIFFVENITAWNVQYYWDYASDVSFFLAKTA